MRGCTLIDESIAANVSLVVLKKLSFLNAEKVSCNDVENKESIFHYTYKFRLKHSKLCASSRGIFASHSSKLSCLPPARASSDVFIYTQFHFSDIANADSDSQ